MPPYVIESTRDGEPPKALVSRLAREKARAVADRIVARGPLLVIAADTTVVAPDGGAILGKPRDPADARRMLGLLSGKSHVVLTGYCVQPVDWPGKVGRLLRVVRSRVRLRALSRRDIEAYVRTGEPMDKAGAYAAQGVGMALIESIQGSYTNVVGLPLCQLLTDLERGFQLALFPERKAGKWKKGTIKKRA